MTVAAINGILHRKKKKINDIKKYMAKQIIINV